MTTPFITPKTLSGLTSARLGNKKSVDVPNYHPSVGPEQREIWKSLAKKAGIDFDKTGHTVRIVKGDSSNAVYHLMVANNMDNEPCLLWGKVSKPLSEIQADFYPYAEGQKTYICLSFPDTTELIIPMMFIKVKDNDRSGFNEDQLKFIDSKNKQPIIDRAIKNGNLSLYLGTYTPRVKLVDLVPGQEYKVISYRYEPRFETYKIFIEGLGESSANSAISKILELSPDINQENPATMCVRPRDPEKDVTSQGHPIVPLDYFLLNGTDNEVFDFDQAMSPLPIDSGDLLGATPY